jgi:hypothetical protein
MQPSPTLPKNQHHSLSLTVITGFSSPNGQQWYD